MKAVIIANGSINNLYYFSKLINQADLIICADNGANHLKKIKIMPHVIIGDLDSITLEDQSFFEANNIKIVKHPSDKDMTDTELAACYAIDQECKEITFLGVTGTRLDHTLANIFLLKKLSATGTELISDKKIKCKIVDDNNEIFIVTDKLLLEQTKNSFVSLIPLTEKVEGITTSGLKYPLTNADINIGSSIGISNQFIERKAVITIRKGTLIVMISKD